MPEPRIKRARFCSQCGSAVVVADASFCKECGAPLPSTVWLSPSIKWNPWTAALLSVIPGLGHWYKGARLRGFAWFVAVLFAYGLAPPIGLMIHVICAGNAALEGALREDALTARRERRRSARLASSARASR
jgi:hypothetical protein